MKPHTFHHGAAQADTEEFSEAEAVGNTLLSDFFNRVRCGRPKVIVNLTGDVIVVA